MSYKKDSFVKVLSYYNLIDDVELYDKQKILCPFHSDLNPSMLVDFSTNTFYCFGCGRKGDIIKFIELIEKIDSLTAYVKYGKIMKAIEKSHINIRKRISRPKAEMLLEAKAYFYSLDKTNWYEVKKHYLFERGYDPKVLIDFDVRINESNNRYPFAIPVYDMKEFKGYICRSVEPDNPRKYLYNEGFSRRTTLVGKYTKKWVVITEGIMDLMKLRQFGVYNAVAILGWKITDEQIIKLKKYTNCVISALDNTGTGYDGTKILEKYFKVVRFQFSDLVKDAGDLDIYEFNKSWSETKDIINNKRNRRNK